MIVVPRRITASPIVTMTMANCGSPSIGRMKMRSSSKPISIAAGMVMAISATKWRLSELAIEKAM